MKEVLLLKCGEIVLKGLNRKTFEDRLLKNLKRRMAHVADCEISMRQSVVYVEIPDDADADAVMECASRVFGFATISRAAVCPEKTLESVIAAACASPEMLSALSDAISALSGKTYTLDMQMQSALEICRLAAAKPQQYTVSPDGTWKRNS